MIVILLLVLWLVGRCALAAQGQTSQEKPEAGQIVGIIGKWDVVQRPNKSDDHHKVTNPLRFADPISSGACVAGDGGRLTVRFTKTGEFVSVPCEGKPEPGCDLPANKKCARLIPAEAPKGKSLMVSLAAEFVAMFQDSERYVTPVSRGLEPHLSDGVLKLVGDQLDFAPAFADFDSGVYSVRIEPLDGHHAAGVVRVEWNGRGSAPSRVAGLKPGLYRLVRVDAQSQPVELGAWELVDGPDRFDKDSAGFHSAKEETRTWPDDVDPRVPGAVLRAYLDSLAKSQTTKH